MISPEFMKQVSRYAKTRDGLFSILLAGGVWLANDVKQTAEEIQRNQAAMDRRITAIETTLARR